MFLLVRSSFSRIASGRSLPRVAVFEPMCVWSVVAGVIRDLAQLFLYMHMYRNAELQFPFCGGNVMCNQSCLVYCDHCQ